MTFRETLAKPVAGIPVALLLTAGLFVVNPNEGKVLTLFGTYKGTAKAPGLWFTNPFMSKKAISLRARNFETGKLKVNDARSNPVDIAAVVVWRVTDTAEATFEVNDYLEYVHMQSESALRALASTYPYDTHGAVGMVQMALAMLTAERVVEFDEERKAAMVSNLLVVLCSARAVTPVVNTGTIHH